MVRTLKKLIALVLCLALLVSTLLVAGIFNVSAEEDYLQPYPVYREIDFSKYVPSTSNSYFPVINDVNYTKELFWNRIDDSSDPSVTGGSYIRYDSTTTSGSGTTWKGNHAFVPSETGSIADNEIVLPTSTRFKVVFKIRTDEVEYGLKPFVSFGSSMNSVHSGNPIREPNITLKPTNNEWVEFSYSFTTPDSYTTVSNTLYNKAFFGFIPVDAEGKYARPAYSYDIDHMTLYIVNDANTRVVDFSEYKVGDSGMWGPSQGEGTPKEDTWGHVYKDATLSGGSYYNYYGRLLENNKGINTWYAHYSIAPTVYGSVSTSGDMLDPNNIVLPTSTTYRLTVRMKVNEVSGKTVLYRSFTNSGSAQGDATAIATLGVTEGYEEYV
ncbi:MAG: hypothetical protein UIG59_00295, partial [Acutalibacteraceae bacterium]|nr:hypothetical protein [Acutalibacteraceae bacterium]